jgi:ASC-1-like (ASCH) protein
MSDQILDLDALAPQPKKVKLGGKIIDVNPPRLKQLIKLVRIFSSLENVKDKEALEDVNQIVEELEYMAPGIKDMDLTIDQMRALIEFAMIQSQTPAEAQKKGANSDSPAS